MAGERRLAVQVEHHSRNHAGFEGTIPAESYGAGAAIVWDRGVWMPVGDSPDEVRLEFILACEKMAGRWHLLRMRDGHGGSRAN